MLEKDDHLHDAQMTVYARFRFSLNPIASSAIVIHMDQSGKVEL